MLSHRLDRRPSTALACFVTLSVCALLGLGVTGCRPDGPALFPVSGSATLRDQPLAGAELMFHPQFDGPGWFPVATVAEDGSFTVSTKRPGDGALPGRYKVTVTWYPTEADEEASRNRAPHRYTEIETTPLEVEVASAPTELPPLRLTP